jgi:translation initiation factor 4G
MTSVSPVNGKTSIPGAATGLAGPPIAVGHNVMNGGPGAGHPVEHNRKSSLTISAAGATGYRPNGAPVVGSSARPNSIQFGSMNVTSSPSASYSVPHQPHHHQSASSLAVTAAANPRIASPQSSPSPIPQPQASGGRPPAGLHAHANAMSFGSIGGDANDNHVS